jgi:6-pyruvoyltetrahydropterin/6-carboxytetrahydropterin synthase
MITLTRRYRFPAAHVLANRSFSDEENRRVYGYCANPAGHGHDYGVEVTVTGPVDERTGQLVDPEELDAIFDESIRRRFSHRLLNEDELFFDRVPTAENIAIAIHERLGENVARRTRARLLRVRIIETPRNSFSYGELT